MLVALLAACTGDPNAEVEAHFNELAATVGGPCGLFKASRPARVCMPPASDVSPIVACLQDKLTSGGEATATGSFKYYGTVEDMNHTYTGERFLFVVNREVIEISHTTDQTEIWEERHCKGIAITDAETNCPSVYGTDCDE